MPSATIGAAFGRLTLVEPLGRNQSGRRMWKCQCACGATIERPDSAFSNQRSCGCLRAERDGQTSGELTQLRLQEILHYDPQSGAFTWLTKGARRKSGDDNRAGYAEPSGYLAIRLNGRLYRASRLAFLYMTGTWPPHLVDHINGDRSDDRWCNLREATFGENGRNRGSSRGRSKHKGVWLCPTTQRWAAMIAVNRKRCWLGRYDSEDEAAVVYNEAAKRVHGEFARLNQVGDS